MGVKGIWTNNRRQFKLWTVRDAVNQQPIIVETTGLLELPKFCVCCGKATRRTVAIKPADPTNFKQELALDALALAFPPAHVALGFKVLSTPNATIPLCGMCRLKHFFPDPKLFTVIGLLVLFFIGAFFWGLRAQYGLMLLNLLLAVACLVFVARKNMPHDIGTLPVRIYRFDGKYRYAIFGGPLYDHVVNAPPVSR
jgi:hypothetical protein